MEFLYTINPTAETPIMFINDHIGYDEELGMGVSGDRFAKELMYLDSLGVKQIDVWINTVGGSIIEGMSIYNAILNSKCKVNTRNVGLCASMGFVLLQAGRDRSCMDYAISMTHNVQGGNEEDQSNKAFGDSLITMITRKSNVTRDQLVSMMNDETWFNSDEMKRYGFCDEIISSSDINIKRAPKADSANITNSFKELRSYCNNVLIPNKKKEVESNSDSNKDKSQSINNNKSKSNNIKNQTNMLNVKIAGVLELPTETSDERIYEGVVALQNKLEDSGKKIIVSDDKLERLTNKYEAKKKEVEDLTNSHKVEIDNLTNIHKTAIEDLQNQLSVEKAKVVDFEKQAELARLENLTNEATHFINDAVKVGKFENKAEVVQGLVNQYVANPELTKTMINAIPINKENPLINTFEEANRNSNVGFTGKLKNGFQTKMAEVRERLSKQ